MKFCENFSKIWVYVKNGGETLKQFWRIKKFVITGNFLLKFLTKEDTELTVDDGR